MGKTTSKILSSTWHYIFANKPNLKAIILGAQKAGKTSVMNMLKYGILINTNLTIGFNAQTIQFQKFLITIWDIGFWQQYIKDTHIIIFVIDSSDRTNMQYVKEQFDHMLIDDKLMKAKYVLVVANKQDLPNAMRAEQISNELQIERIMNMKYKIIETSAITGVGFGYCLDWLRQTVRMDQNDV